MMSAKELVNNLSITEKIEIYNWLYEDLAGKGIGGGTELAHVNKTEMAVLRAMGGSGTINPNTNLIQFMDDDPPPPPPSVTTTTQTSEFPSELRPFVQDIFEKSQAIQEQRQEEGFSPELTQRLAAFTPEQQASFTGIEEVVGQSRPLFDEATALSRGAARAATDPEEVAALMNPFLRNVTDIEKREAQRAADVQRQQLDARAAQAGAFGGSRAAILEAERQRNLNQQLGDIEARGRLAAFQDAQNRLQQQFGREAGTAAQLGALGSAIPAQTFKELGALSGIGAAKQQQAQRALDIATQQAREEFGFPMRTLQDFSAILRGFPLPATKDVTQKTFSPAQPLATQLLGVGTGLAGLAGAAGAFKKAGGRVGGPSPVRLKHGGYIKLAAGGGLSQLMRGKLPSNRVRMGKTAYQDVGISEEAMRQLSTDFNLFLYGPNPVKLDADDPSTFASRPPPPSEFELATFTEQMKSKYGDEAVELVLKTLKFPNLSLGSGKNPGEIAIKAVSEAASLKEEPSVLQKAFAALKPEFGPSSVSAQVPISESQLLAQHRDRNRATPPAAVDEIDMTTAFTAGVSPDVSPPNLMSAASPAAESINPLTAFGGAPVSPPNLMSASSPAVPFSFDDVSGQKIDVSDAFVRQRMGERILRKSFLKPELHPDKDPLAVEKRKEEAFNQRKALEARKLLSAQQSGGLGGEFSGLQTAEELAKKQTAKSQIASMDATSETAPPLASIDNTTDPAGKTPAAKKAEPDGGLAMDGAEVSLLTGEIKDPAKVAALQVDYDQQIADIKNKDYSADIKKMIGDAPTYEKGEEPDFAARKWLALANFGAGLLASGGGKTLAQSIGEAAKPALKELADIGKEERKIKKELRQERNAQKRADYQDDLQRFNLQRQLRSDDLDAIKMVTDISHKEQQLKISRKNAESARSTAIANAGLQRLKTDTLIFDNFMKQKGYRTLDEVRKELDSYKQSFIKSQLSIAKASAMPYSADKIISEANRMYAAEAPNLINRAVGNTMRTDDEGNVIPYTREELVQRLAPLGATKPAGGGQGTLLGTVKGGARVFK